MSVSNETNYSLPSIAEVVALQLRIETLTAEVERLREALKGSIGALEFSRDYHSDLSNAEQAFAQDRLDAARAALAARGLEVRKIGEGE